MPFKEIKLNQLYLQVTISNINNLHLYKKSNLIIGTELFSFTEY